MHFSKELAELLLTLPPELSSNAIEYRKLKKLIHDVVDELESLGLSPGVLQQLLQREATLASPPGVETQALEQSTPSMGPREASHVPRVVYELSSEADRIESGLRVRLPHQLQTHRTSYSSDSSESRDGESDKEDDEGHPGAPAIPSTFSDPSVNLLYALQNNLSWPPPNHASCTDARSFSPHGAVGSAESGSAKPLILSRPRIVRTESADNVFVPLLRDEEFYGLLHAALQSLAKYFDILHSNFISALYTLATEISNVARPLSSTSSFHPHSNATDPATISTSFFFRSPSLKSDLSVWREIFQLYTESEIFESVSERTHGERAVQDADARLKAFSDRVTSRGLGDHHTLRHKDSRDALASFLRLNALLLNIKKFQFYNSEALRKILKKHAKRTALPHPLLSDSQRSEQMTFVVPAVLKTLPRTLVQAIGEVLLPVIPHIDDYSCAICMSIAFKPIRLTCGHLFCVRCLVKMQKRGQDNCPMCRSPTVAIAGRSNVDWALLNFLQDWFPEEAYAKLRANEREAAQEQMEELGIESSACIIN